MPTPFLSIDAARCLQLSAQGLLTSPKRKAVRSDVTAAIRRMALLQIDTISVVARSPYLVLFSRLGAYDPSWLDDALCAGEVFEYWAHEACFVPSEDYGLFRRFMLDTSETGWKRQKAWVEKHAGEIERLLGHIRANGPVRSADFARPGGKSNGWWDWKPEKHHLEALFVLGELMVRERKHFHRVYDLAERVRPDWSDERDTLSREEAEMAMIRNSCRALGLVKPAWVADYYRLKRRQGKGWLTRLTDDGELLPVRVEGWEEDVFVHASLAPRLSDAEAGKLGATATAILSPFDPVVWDRRRALELFGFDYRIECYTPAAKRKYGYFVLPILRRGRLVGRLDAKAHRREGVFEVKALYLEEGVRPGIGLWRDIDGAVRKLANWHGTPLVRYGRLPDGLPPGNL
ncbi:winged helix-turn-helix domain-containing protein [Paludibacterium paludis]|uniref:Winged helix-turn-helix domain-containing protein n=1 Tax=Paludibacterium paludis TaxID=1225769 RepID=A0A918P1K6_9NEIS|nr:winged helix-turn-helix domain-containing protein [Paludibacterium paludis]GGY12455.1 hypothetical protein GCM10011289_14540 [Paludibacterium paludis]